MCMPLPFRRGSLGGSPNKGFIMVYISILMYILVYMCMDMYTCAELSLSHEAHGGHDVASSGSPSTEKVAKAVRFPHVGQFIL